MTSPREPADEVRHIVPVPHPGGRDERALLVVEPRPGLAPPDAPLVLTSSGLGGTWADWLSVADALGPRARLLLTERPGVGDAPRWDEGTTELDAAADDLAAALDAVGAGRAVLVGHSMGAWYVEACARRHPDRVAGLVLLDGSLAVVPRLGARARRVPGFALRHAVVSGMGLALDTAAWSVGGWHRLGPRLRELAEDRLLRAAVTDAQREHHRRVYARRGSWVAIAREWAAYRRLRAQLVALRGARRLPPVPVTAVVAVRGPLVVALHPWALLQRRLLRRLADLDGLPRTRIDVIHEAPHTFMPTHPEPLAASILATITAAG